MFLSKRNNGYYYVVYKAENGKRTLKATRTKNKREAFQFLHKFKAQYEIQCESLPEISLWEFAAKFMRYSEAYHTKLTARDYALTFKKLFKYFGNPALSDLTRSKIQLYITDRISKGSIYQGRKDLINIKAALNWAVKEEYLYKNPASQIKRIKVPERLPIFFTKDEFEKLISNIDEEDIHDIAVVAVNTGMRQGELIKLEWQNIHWEMDMIILDNHTFINKSKKVRSIPMNERVKEVLRSRYNSRISDNVFTYNDERFNQDFLVHKFKKYIRKAGLRDKLNFHSLRHTFATWLVQGGASIYQVSKLLGHADVSTTQVYAHLNSEDLRESLKILE